MDNSEIDDLVKTIKRDYLKYNLLKYGSAIALGFISARLYKCCIVENPNTIAIVCCIALMLFCIAAVLLSFKFYKSITKHAEEILNAIVCRHLEISYQLSTINDNDYAQKYHLKQEEVFLNEATRKLFAILP